MPEYYAELKDTDGRHLGEKFFAVAADAAESHAVGLLKKAHGSDARIARIEVYRRTLTNQRALQVHEISLCPRLAHPARARRHSRQLVGRPGPARSPSPESRTPS